MPDFARSNGLDNSKDNGDIENGEVRNKLRTYPLLSEYKNQLLSSSDSVEQATIFDETLHDVYSGNLSKFDYFFKKQSIRESKTFLIPKIIKSMLLGKKYNSLCGVALCINSVWFSYDQNLILWNPFQNKYKIIKETDSVINAVKIIEAPSCVRTAKIQFIIFVCDTKQISVLVIEPDDSEMYKINYKQSVLLEEIQVNKIVATRQGKIYVGSDDGDVYELQYLKQLSRKCIFSGSKFYLKVLKKCGFFENLLTPLKRLFKSRSNLVDLVVDDSRGLLYALYSNDGGEIYCWRTIDTDAEFICSFKNIIKHVDNTEANNFRPFPNQTFLSLHPVSFFLAKSCAFFVVTNFCTRIFFDISKIKKINVLYVRKNPLETNPSNASSSIVLFENKEVEKTFFNENLFISIFAYNPSERLTISAIEVDEAPKFKKSSETVDLLTFGDEILDFVEVPGIGLKKKTALYCFSDEFEIPISGLSKYALSHLSSQRIFLILTNNDLKVFQKQNYLHDLSELFECDYKTERLIQFSDLVGDREACALCLSLICCEVVETNLNDGIKISSKSTQDDIKTKARSAYFTVFGGSPVILSEQTNEQENQPPSKEMIFSGTAMYKKLMYKESGRLSGLSSFLSRVFRPLWRIPVVSYGKTEEFEEKIPYASVPLEVFKEVLSSLTKLNDFLFKYKNLFYSNKINKAKSSFEENSFKDIEFRKKFVNCVNAELDKIEGLHKVSIRGAEILHFFVHTMSSATYFNSIFCKVEGKQRKILLESAFSDFIYDEKSENALRCLMIQAVNSDHKELHFLEKHSPSIFRLDDIYICEGIKLIENAVDLYPNKALYFKELEKADKKFCLASEISKQKFPLDKIFGYHVYSRNYPGVLKLCFKLMNLISFDMNDIVIDKKDDTNNEIETKTLTEKDCMYYCFEAFNRALGSLNEGPNANESPFKIDAETRDLILSKMKNIVFEKNSKNFEYKIFDYLLDKEYYTFLLSFYPKSYFVCDYLIENSTKNIKAANAAFSLYLQTEMYIEGSKLARYWAVVAKEVPIEERYKFILKAQRLYRGIENPTQDDNNFNLVSKHYQIRMELQILLLKYYKNPSTRVKEAIRRNRKVKDVMDKKKKASGEKLDKEEKEAEYINGVLKVLETSLVPISKLYRLAKECECYKVCFSILDRNFIEDLGGELLKEMLRFVVRNELTASKTKKAEKWAESLKQILKSLISEFRTLITVKLEYLILFMEAANVEINRSGKNWIPKFLVNCGFDIVFIIEKYTLVVDIVLISSDYESFRENFRWNFYLTMSITKALELFYSDFSVGKMLPEDKFVLITKGLNLLNKWSNYRIDAPDNAGRRAKEALDQKFCMVEIQLSNEVDKLK